MGKLVVELKHKNREEPSCFFQTGNCKWFCL